MAKTRFSVIASATVVIASCLYFAEAHAIDCFSLSLEIPTISFKLGSDIPLNFTLKNCGINTVWRKNYGAGSTGYTDYLVSVTREDGSELVKTPTYQAMLLPESISHVFLSHIAPGKTMSDSTDLRNIVDIGQPGTYHVVATTKVPDSVAGPREVQSNTLTFVIEPKETLP